MAAIEIVNCVGAGSLGVELDLEKLDTDLEAVNYDPEKYPGAYLRLDDDILITIYRTGKYIITGAISREGSYEKRRQFLEYLVDNGVLAEATDERFSMVNYVCVGEIPGPVNLNALAIGLGLERTEYEPEQFPGLVYRPSMTEVVTLIFGSGKVVLTGAKSPERAAAAFETLQSTIESLVE